MTDTVPLNKLILSPRNVRKTNGDEDIESLADSIHSKGLLQNLVVSQSPPNKKGGGKLYEVDAGDRRLRALQLLVARKDLARNWPVPVHVIARADATEASLAENLDKIAMNPADEVEVFATIVSGYEEGGIDDQATRIANCARRFGRTKRYVRQRLALAALAPEILDALRDGSITIASASAYAAHPDQKLQLKVFKEQCKRSSHDRHSPQAIRNVLGGKVYTADHKAVRYIGIDAYCAAGGVIEPDLFLGEEERDLLIDTKLVDRLVGEKAAAEAQRLAQADGWLDGVVKPWTGAYYIEAKAPDGFRLSWGAAKSIEGDDRAGAMAYYEIAEDGSGLELVHHCFTPLVTQGEATGQPHYTPETPQQRAARERTEAIEVKAIHLAAPSVVGTPFEDRAFWPANTRDRWIDAIEEDDDGDFIVALLVKVTRADVEAAMAEAERRYDLEQAELAEEAALLKAEQSSAHPEEGSPEPVSKDETEQVAA